MLTIEIDNPEDEALIEARLASGHFGSLPELIHHALVSLPALPVESEQRPGTHPFDWRTMRGMARGGASLTEALMEERAAEQAHDNAGIQGS